MSLGIFVRIVSGRLSLGATRRRERPLTPALIPPRIERIVQRRDGRIEITSLPDLELGGPPVAISTQAAWRITARSPCDTQMHGWTH